MAAGKSIKEVCKALGSVRPRIIGGKREYGGADVSAVRENKALRDANTRLKKLVADMAMLKELAEGKW